MIIETKQGDIVSGKEQFWDMLIMDGKREIKPFFRKRTLDQNAYLHSLFGNIAKDVGEELDYIKRLYKDKYLKGISKNKGIEYIRDTSSLKTIELNEFIDKILNHISEFGYKYPTPEEWKAGKRFSD